MGSALADGWWVVIPVKGGPRAKSRLGVADRVRLADAMAKDTVAAAMAGMPSGRVVVVVTADPVTASWASELGVQVAADPGGGLNAAVRAAALAVRSDHDRVAVLLGDHPAMQPNELTEALATAAAYEAVIVPDHGGTGTALLAANAGVSLRPQFGPGSAASHEALGYVRLPLDLPGLRWDVDDVYSLQVALALGVGKRTLHAVAGTLERMQATVHRVEDTWGSVLLDDGREVAFEAGALATSGLRHLRVGQRVSVELGADESRATRVWMVGIGEGETIR